MNTPTLVSADTKFYDNTRVSAYKVCPRSYAIRHLLHWTPDGTGKPLVFGSAWHEGMDVIYQYAKRIKQPDIGSLASLAALAFNKYWTEEGGFPLEIPMEQLYQFEPRTPGIAHEMFFNYITARWDMLQRCDVVAIEQPFAVPIPGVENVLYIGKLDKVVDFNGQRLILEHKSTTAYATIGNFRQDYVESWYMSSQVTGYQFGGNLFFGNVDGIWVDAALVHKKVHDAFKFIPVSHNTVLLREWISGTSSWIAQIRAEEDEFAACGELHPKLFKKNTESCYGKYGSCPFLDICRSMDDPTKLEGPPGGFHVEKWEPFDVLKMNKILQVETTDNET